MKAKLKNSLIIVAVGLPQEGKTTMLCFIMDAIKDLGITEIKDKNTLLTQLLANKPIQHFTPKIVLYDDVNNEHELASLRATKHCIVIRVRRHRSANVDSSLQWVENSQPDLVLNNDYELRRFDFVVRDAVKNLLPEIKQWKESIEL